MFCEECDLNYIEKMKPKLLDHGQEITNVENIMNIQNRFYENLYISLDWYTKKLCVWLIFFDKQNPYINTLNKDEGIITKDKCFYQLIETSENGKSAELAGCTA